MRGNQRVSYVLGVFYIGDLVIDSHGREWGRVRGHAKQCAYSEAHRHSL
ncbi:unnamed protein product [Staurois parvus]|uniref:Uncharacterized protein n=1 Tax=Staurois parvus TaxID=386267 RepID=A0ABN9E743_9NEOB|nr:unnamed protein product [Staurois parvus]